MVLDLDEAEVCERRERRNGAVHVARGELDHAQRLSAPSEPTRENAEERLEGMARVERGGMAYLHFEVAVQQRVGSMGGEDASVGAEQRGTLDVEDEGL